MTGAVADRPRDLLVSGHVIIDRFLSVRSFPAADRTVPVLQYRAELGGTATNIVRAASKLGVATGLVARVGDGFPDEYVAEFRRSGSTFGASNGSAVGPRRPATSSRTATGPSGR